MACDVAGSHHGLVSRTEEPWRGRAEFESQASPRQRVLEIWTDVWAVAHMHVLSGSSGAKFFGQCSGEAPLVPALADEL